MTEPSHRGAFGDFGGASGGLIERTFRERIVLVGVTLPPHDAEDTDSSLDELAQLVDTAGADEVGPRRAAPQRAPTRPPTSARARPRSSASCPLELDCDTVVFDDELSPGPAVQPREAARAHGHRPHRGDPRHLRPERPQPGGQGPGRAGPAPLPAAPPARHGPHAVSQQAGGIGTRGGPGETQLEVDRRRIVRRIHKLEAELRDIARHRATQRKAQRRSSRCNTVAIVGYTNAGKSTLLNRLTEAGVLVEDRLFATLDATTRRLDLPGGETVLRHRHGRLHPQAAPPAGRGVQVDARRGGRGRPAGARRRRVRPRPRRATSTRCAQVLERDRRRPGARAARVQQGRPGAGARPSRLAAAHPGSVGVSAEHRRGHRRPAARDRRPAAGARPTSSSCSCPSTAATCSPRSTARARCWPSSPTTTACASGSASTTPAASPAAGVRRAAGRRAGLTR